MPCWVVSRPGEDATGTDEARNKVSPRNDSPEESLASPDEPVDENLPGGMLAEDLADPEPYEVAADEAEAEELEADAEASALGSEVEVDDPEQLRMAETAAARARSARPKRRVAEVVHTPPTPAKGRRKARPMASKRTTPKQFAEESAEELRKVVWPTWSQVQQLFWAVLVLVLFVIAYVSLVDLGFGWALLQLFGRTEG